MRVGLAQMDCEPNDVAANTDKILAFITEAATENCDVVVFPEMSDTGYVLTEATRVSQSWDKGVVPAIQSLAKDLGINVVAGLSELDGETTFNGIASIDRTGRVASRYRKTHLVTVEPMFEDKILGRGEHLGSGRVADEAAGFMTCYELRFPEVARSLVLEGAQILFLPSAWPLVRVDHWNTLVRARAIENQAFVVAVNRVGTDGPGLTFCGSSQVVNPYGTVLTSASEIEERLLTVDIEMAAVDRTRSHINVFADRRPELYGAISRPIDL